MQAPDASFLRQPTACRLLFWLICAVALAVLGDPPSAWAQQVQPMAFSLEPSGAGASTTVRMENNRAVPITVEVAVNAISVDEDGAETWTPADEDFQIFPPQSLIQPGRSQAFRVRYVGDPAITRSRAYRVSLRQLPVALAEGDSGIAVALNFNTLVNVVPPASRSDLVLTDVRPAESGGWTAVLENRGDRYVRLTRTVWRFEAVGHDPIERAGVDVFGDVERNLVPPGARRRLAIPRLGDLPGEAVTITVHAPATE